MQSSHKLTTAHTDDQQHSTGVCDIPDTLPEHAFELIFKAVASAVDFCVYRQNTDTPPTLPPSSLHSSNAISSTAHRPSFQCMSSGSTGAARRIRRSHASWILSFEQHATLFQLSVHHHYVILGNLSHSLALYATLEAAHIGATIHFLPQQRPRQQFQTIANLTHVVLYATPTQLRYLCLHSTAEQHSHAVQFIFCGGGSLTSEDVQLFLQYFPSAQLRYFYGASETSFISWSEPLKHDTPLLSVGHAYPDVHIDIRNAQGHSLPRNTLGEIWVSSPYLFTHYAAGQSPSTQRQGDYLSVGELGYLNNKEQLVLLGRKDRMVTIADQNCYPEVVENTLKTDPDVIDCVVVAVPDKQRGNVFIAALDASESDALHQRLRTLTRHELEPLIVPKSFVFLRNFPYLTSGKPDIQTITKQLKQQP